MDKARKKCDWWCVVDYGPRFVLVAVGVARNNGELLCGISRMPDNQYIVQTANEEESEEL